MKLACEREGSGPAVLLVHGVGGDASNWSAIRARLRARFDVISIDLRGHGKSPLVAGPIGVADFASDAMEVLDAENVAACRVAGFSLGGAVALALALDFPGRVEKLAVIGTVCGRTPEERAKAAARIEFARQHGVGAVAQSNRERWFTDDFLRTHPDIVEARVAQVRASDPASYLHSFAVFCTADFSDRLHEIKVPTLIVTGEHDVAATPRMACLMHERIPGSQVHVLPGLRHSLLIEAPDRVASLLDAFL